MRKNVKQQLALRVLSTAALMAMVSSIATAAFAAEYNVTDGSVEIVAKDGSQYITQWEDKSKDTCVKDADGEIRDRKDENIILTTKDATTSETNTTGETATTGETTTTGEIKTTTNTITVEAKAGNTANVTLRDVNITKDTWSSGSAAMTIKGEGNTEIELDGKNTLISGRGHAGLVKANDVSQGSLTIKDDLNDNGTEKRKDESDTVGSLNVVGRGGSAAIGGHKTESGPYNDPCQNTSNIKITGGCIKAGPVDENLEYYKGAYQDMWGEYNCGAGIGGASSYGDAKNITITGNADVTAAGGYYSAGIGGGEYGDATNITISGNAKVTASGSHSGGAGIGGGDEGAGKNIRITDNADVTAYGGYDGAGIGGGRYCGGSVEISKNATVTAAGSNGGAGIGSGSQVSIWSRKEHDTTVVISDKANVTAVGSYEAAAIGTGYGCTEGKTTITITGGTVKAIGGKSYINCWNGKCTKSLASAIGGGYNYDGKVQDVTVTINGKTGNTIVDASCWLDQESAISTGNGAADIIGYDKYGKSPFGEKNSVIVRMYNNGSYPDYSGDFKGDLAGCKLGDLYQTVHNRKYMEEHPEEIVDITKLKDEDLHDWQLVKRVEPTLDADGYADYICSIDKCGQTKHVVLPKLIWEGPDTPETPDPTTPTDPEVPGGNTPGSTPDTPKQPDGTTPAPVTPDAPAQDSTAPADTLAADTTADTAAAQNVAQNAEPKAAAAAAVLPQTGANWLAVVGTALSGLFLLAAGFVLDRKNRRMN